MTQRPGRIAALVLVCVIAAAHLSLAPAIASVASIHHIGHAAPYAAHGIWDTSLPWATHSIMGDLGGDLWWGLHVVLVPFTLLAGVATQIRVASVVFTLALAGVMVRPHVLSLALALVLLSVMIRGRWWQVLLAAGGMGPGLHWEQFFLSPHLIQDCTCDAYPCADGEATETWGAIRCHFGARWVVVGPLRKPKFTTYLLNDARFTLALETQHEALFRVLESMPPPLPTEP